MTHALTDYGIYTVCKSDGSTSPKVIDDMVINLSLNDLNYATFVSPVYFAVGDRVDIKYQTVTTVFRGVVTQCRKLARTIDNVTRYDIEVTELAIELTSTYIMSETVSGLYINNTTKEKNLGFYVRKILEYSDGWEDISNSEFKTVELYTGGTSDVAIPSVGFSRTTIYTALQRLLVSIFNYGIWFEYPTAGRKCIRYGSYNRELNVGSYPTPTNISMLENSNNYNVSGVIVYGDTDDFVVRKGDCSQGSSTLVYRYSGCQSMTELSAIATKIYNERSTPNIRYEIEFPPGFYNIREGDKIHIYDTSVGLPYNADGYGIKDVRITTEKTTAGLGTAKMTVFDILNDRLSIIDGGMIYSSPTTDSTGFGNVYSDPDNPANYGEISECTFTVGASTDTFLGDFFITPSFSAIGNDGAGYFRIYSSVVSADELTVSKTAPAYISTGGASHEGYEPIFTTDMFPWSWQWVEMKVQYALSDENETNAAVNWTCEWPGVFVMDRGGNPIPAQSSQRTVEHIWYVGQCNNIDYSYPVFTITVPESATPTQTKMIGIVVSISVYYYSSASMAASSSLSTGTVDMKVQNYNYVSQTYYDASNWITIYDASNPSAYIDKEYDMDEYVDYKIFNSGAHKFLFRCKGDHPDAPLPGVAVSADYRYLSIEGKIEVIP